MSKKRSVRITTAIESDEVVSGEYVAYSSDLSELINVYIDSETYSLVKAAVEFYPQHTNKIIQYVNNIPLKDLAFTLKVFYPIPEREQDEIS